MFSAMTNDMLDTYNGNGSGIYSNLDEDERLRIEKMMLTARLLKTSLESVARLQLPYGQRHFVNFTLFLFGNVIRETESKPELKL